MKIMSVKRIALYAAFGLASTAMADNPISTYHYLADPGAAADDEYFYIITDSDDPAAYNASGYSIKALYGFRSKDMQNWTDFGIIYDARKVEGIGDIWASGIAVHDGTFYIVFPDGGGGGIGYIKAPAIEGPWENAVSGKSKLIAGWGNGLIDCDGVSWCFDPGIFIDDDGTSYVTWGGGESDSRPNTDNFDIVKLNDAKNGISGSAAHVKVNNLPTRKMLEASYIHKYNNKYYFSYSTGWQQGAPTIDYAMSDNVMGPYTWKGTILEDPNINGKSINGNNNHHGIAGFKGHWYAVYHDRRIAKGHNGLEIIPADDGVANPNEGYHRSVSVDEMFYNADGTIQSVKFTNEGPEQIENFDPYDWYPALTSSKQKGIRSRSNFVQGRVAEHYLLPLSTKESWIRVSGVDFGTAASSFSVEAASAADGNTIEIRTGSATGPLAGTCELANTGSKTTFDKTTCEVEGLSGVVDYLFLVFKGRQDSTMSIKYWGFEGSGSDGTSTPKHTPYGDEAFELPGIIEAEHFDKGGARNAYSDSDSENKGDADFRTDEGVDIVLVDSADASKGMAIGYTSAGEWLRYTVNVTKAGSYKLAVIGASGNESGSTIQFKVDNKNVGGEITIATGSWQVYDQFDASEEVELAEGEHVIQLNITGDFANIDKIAIGADFPEETEPENPEAIVQKLNVLQSGNGEFKVYNLRGELQGLVNIAGENAANALKNAGFGNGIYMLKQVGGSQKMMVNTAK